MLVAKYPTAVQNVADAHDTPFKVLLAVTVGLAEL
jgi:hypothetical protein